MTSKATDSRARRRREHNKIDIKAGGAQLYYPCKVYDGDGNLVKEVSPDEQMAQDTNVNKFKRKKKEPSYKQLNNLSGEVNRAKKEGRGLVSSYTKIKSKE